MTLYDLLFTINDSTNIALFDNETGEMITHPATCDEIRDAVGEYENCEVMDIHTEVQFGIAVINICIEIEV